MYGSTPDVKPRDEESDYSNQSYPSSASPQYTELGTAEPENMAGAITGHDILFNNQCKCSLFIQFL